MKPETVQLARDLMRHTLHGPPPIATTMALAEAVIAGDADLAALRIEHEAVCGLLTHTRKDRDELRTLLQRVVDIERIDAHRAGYTGCKRMARSRAAEQAYEMGRCPHQLSAAALAGGKS